MSILTETFIASFQCPAIQNRSKRKSKPFHRLKSRIWEKKEGKYAKTLARIQVTAIFLKQDMRRNMIPKFKEICMAMPCFCPYRWAPTWRQETNRNICFATKA